MKINILFMTFALAWSCQSSTTQSNTPPASNSYVDLNASMGQLKKELDHIMPLLVQPKEFHNPKNQVLLQEKINSLYKIGTQVSHEPALYGRDPILEYLSVGFQDEITRSFDAFEKGHREFARVSLLNVTAFCIECHTRTNSGPSFDNAVQSKHWNKMRTIDQIDYLIASRQFDQAREMIYKIAAQGLTNEMNVFDLDRAVRLGLLITVRYKQNPAQGITLIEQLEKSKNLPFYLKNANKSWKTQLNQWTLDLQNKSTSDPIASARQLMDLSTKDHNLERFHEINMFRIQAALNPIISLETDPNKLGEALLLLGQSYELTKDLALWSLHESYYETCIRKLPKTEWAKKCYESYERSIYFGYTGSRGTYLPQDVEIKLQQLKKIALGESKK